MKPDNKLSVAKAAGKTLSKWLILFFLFVSPTFAQIKTITGGAYQNTNGSPCAGCVLYLQLGTDATVIGTGQIVPSSNAYQLDANGNVPANSPLWANDQMQPSGLTYKATLTLPGGGQVWGPEFLFISGPSPISLTQIVPVASSSVFFAAPALLGVSNTFTGTNTFSQQIISTVSTGTAPFSIASTTVVPNLNAQLHNGLTAPSSAIVGISDTQTLTNKSIDCTANTLSKNPCVVYSTASASTNASISATTMATAGASGNTYRVSWYFTNTALATSCTGNSTVQFNLIWNDPSEGSAGTSPVQNLITIGSGTANGVLGPIPTHANYNGFWNTLPFRAKANTAVQYSVTFVAGTGCSPAPSYQVFPVLEQIQ